MDFFSFFDKKEKSGKVAKSRLQLVLFQDRMKISPQTLDMLKSDIIAVIANYMEIDQEDLDIKISSDAAESEDGDALPTLIANIPIKNIKRR